MTFNLADAPFSATSPWNETVPTNATYTPLGWPASTGYNYSVAWDSYSPSVYVASSTDPVVQVSVPASWGWPGGTVSVHVPAGATGATGTDGEIVIIDGDTVYNFWQFNRTGTTTATASAYGESNVVTGTGWGIQSPFQGAGTTGAGASELGGLLVQADAAKGYIDHALQLVVDGPLLKPGAVGPAIASDGGSSSGIVQEGELLAIPPGTPMPAGLSPLGQEVFRAMQQYGAYVVDQAAGDTTIRAQANAFDNTTMTALWHDMGSITPLLQAVSGGTPSGSGTTSSGTTGSGTTGTGTSGTGTTAVNWIAANGSGIANGNGDLSSGTVQLVLNFSSPVNVSGTPTLGLNDGGTATYAGGSGSSNLLFNYAIQPGQNTPNLMVSSYNGFSGVTDGSGNSVNLAGAPTWVTTGTIAIDTTAPTVTSISASGTGITNGNGNLSSGNSVQLALGFSEPVNVSGTPTLALNDGGTATYAGGSGTNNLTFNYTVGAGQTTSDLAVSSFNLSGVMDGAGNSVSLTGAPTSLSGTLAIGGSSTSTGSTGSTGSTDPTGTTTVNWIAANGNGIANGNGDLSSGTVQLVLNFSSPVNVRGTPTLGLNDGGTATYAGQADSSDLLFNYTIQPGQNTSNLMVSSYNGFSGVTDGAGNSVNLTGAPTWVTKGTIAIDTTAPTVTGVTTTPSTKWAGTIALDMSEPVDVSGTPKLLLANGTRATYTGGSGSSTLTFSYRSSTNPQVVGAVLSTGSSITDLAGNSANLTGAGSSTASSKGSFTIYGSTELELFGPSTKSVAFASGASGELKLDAASQFAGKVSGFTGHDAIDLASIPFGSSTTLGYTPNGSNTGGTLTVSDGTVAAKIALLGQYTASSFATSADSSGGSLIQPAASTALAPTLAKPA